ncbi:MAG: GGDEF domain-containing protein [Lachnospiraceae bacterium]
MDYKKVIKINFKKHWREYEGLLLFIAALEIFMMCYGIIHFNFEEMRRRLYFVSYVFLLVVTLAAFFVNRRYIKKNEVKHAVINAYIYCIILIFWSAWISGLDIIEGGFPFTYLTILSAVGSLIIFHTGFYGIITILSALFMIVLCVLGGSTKLYFGFYLNLVIFLAVSILMSYRSYTATRSEYIANCRLEELSEMDALTHIANRRSMDKYLDKLEKEQIKYTFALLDVDNFKTINDTHGHEAGDCCLVQIADLLKQNFGDTVFRYGGDEFAVVSFEMPETVLEKMMKMNQNLLKNNKKYRLQVCMGIYRQDGMKDSRTVFSSADQALYMAKQDGKAKGVIFETANEVKEPKNEKQR